MTVSAQRPLAPFPPRRSSDLVCPAVTDSVTLDPRCGLVGSVVVPQPVVSSLHASSAPGLHVPPRTYSTVSYEVCVALQVWKAAAPETEGVQANTCSGAVDVLVHEPACALAPLVA